MAIVHQTDFRLLVLGSVLVWSLVGNVYLLVGRPSLSGAANVSEPIEGRERNVLRRKLLSFERRLELLLGFVGVGGMSSTLDWLSPMRFAVGD